MAAYPPLRFRPRYLKKWLDNEAIAIEIRNITYFALAIGSRLVLVRTC